MYKFPKFGLIILPILFLFTLNINKLLNFNNFRYSFDWEKIVLTNPKYLLLINQYWKENLFLPYKIRNIFYLPWLLILNWLDLIFKLLSPSFLSITLGYSGLIILSLGLINYFKKINKNWTPLIWTLTVLIASGIGILVDSNKAIILALPGLLYFLLCGIKSKYFNFLWKYWLIFLIIDILLR
jgi:hypothetical protein